MPTVRFVVFLKVCLRTVRPALRRCASDRNAPAPVPDGGKKPSLLGEWVMCGAYGRLRGLRRVVGTNSEAHPYGQRCD